MAAAVGSNAPEWYGTALQVCQGWATAGSEAAALEQVGQHFLHMKAACGDPPQDYNALAAVVSQLMSGRFIEKEKVHAFRAGLHAYLARALPASPMVVPAQLQQWQSKDVFQLLTELIINVDLSCIQCELIATLAQAVLIFGRDASALICFLLCMRAAFGWGRGAMCQDETRWLSIWAVEAIQRTEAALIDCELTLDAVMRRFA